MRRKFDRNQPRSVGRWVVAGFGLVLLTSGCSYHRAHVGYDEYDEVRLQTESFSAGAGEVERLGEVVIHEGGAIWRECTDVARGSLWSLVDEAKRRGGNAVGDIRWMPRASPWQGDRPICKRRWGFFLVWPVLATPAFMAANVEGVIYRIDDGADGRSREGAAVRLGDGTRVFRLPESAAETAEWVERVLAETPAGDGRRTGATSRPMEEG